LLAAFLEFGIKDANSSDRQNVEYQSKEKIMITYFEGLMKFSYAPHRKHLLQKLRTLFGIENGTSRGELSDQPGFKGNDNWKYWKEKTDKFWW